ncbi:LysR family transcriptional regulator [Sinirhodobacter populi]|uniref:LysR family transcriptional regulator n=2 Tax=Paenirhodobacter populi TaxID=2306993 RepID=A0A443IQX4_9RHOB|nr:LysR family transcriptional regulator [Sinirhodobacter populi]
MDRLDADRMFVAVLDTGSFAEAARRLGVSGGQASKLISRLESDLGVQLLKRTTRALSPTEVGQAYYVRLKGILEDYDALEASVRNASGAPAGRLRLSAPMSFGTIRLAPRLLDFARAFPDIQLDVSFSDRTVNLIDEGFDMAVRIGAPADSSLIARRLCAVRVVVVAAPDYLARHGVLLAPADLATRDCIIDTNFRDPENWRFHLPGGVATVPVSGRLRFSNGEATLAAAEAGLGIARVPSFIAGESLRAGRVQALFRGTEDPSHSLHAVYPAAKHLAVKVRALVDFLATCYRGEPEWDRGW